MFDNFGPPQMPWKPVKARRHKAIFTAIAGYISTTLVGLGLSTVVAGAVANLAIGAALLGVNALLGGLGKKTQATSTPQAQATINQAAGPRVRGYGRAKLGGTRAFFDSVDAALYQIIMAHHGQIDAFEQFYIGDRAVDSDGNANVITSPFHPFVRIIAHDGHPDQLADNDMLAKWPGVWTADHRLRGIAYWMASFRSPDGQNFQSIFPESYNTPVTCICRLSRVWDPRDPDQVEDEAATWKWSDNAALCILDYLKHPDGYRRSINDIDVPSFVAFANLCDEPVPLAVGGSEPRYRLWGVYSLTDDPQDVLAKMRATCDGEFYQTATGKIAIRGGKWQAPTVTIRDTDILAHNMEQGNNLFAAFNSLKILFTSPDHDFQTVEATSWRDEADIELRGELESPQPLNLDLVPSGSQARRLAKIFFAKANPQWKGSIATNLVGLDALGERTVRQVLPELAIDDAFFVDGFSLRPDLTGVETTVLSISEASYLWSPEEEGQSAPVPQDTRPDLSFPVPDVVSLTEDDGFVTVEVEDPGRDDLDLQAQIRRGAGAIWQEMQVATGGLTGVLGPLEPDTYQVRVRWRGPQNSAGDWSSPLSEITF